MHHANLPGFAGGPGTRYDESRLKQPESIEPREGALILLRNTLRLLDQSMALPEVLARIGLAIREIEDHIATRSE